MLMVRHLKELAMRTVPDQHCYMMADGSPASGFEAFVIVEHCESVYRKMPILYLGYGYMTTADKITSYLFALWLESGLDVSLMRWRLASVRGWCTDWGVESALVVVHDILPSFLQWLGVDEKVEQMRWLFPNAFWNPGWHHLMDSVALDLCCHIRFYPNWLKGVKAVCHFMRIDAYRTVLADLGEEAGFDARRLRNQPPNLAKWRWHTLSDFLNWLFVVMAILREVWSRERFKHCQESKMLKKAHDAITDATWWLQTRIIADVIFLISDLRTSASGCDCHEAERYYGEVVQCEKQGKRLPSAASRVQIVIVPL